MSKSDKSIIRKYDFEKLIALICLSTFGLFIYVLCTKNYIKPVISSPKLIEVCSYIDTHLWAVSIVSLFMFYSSYIFVCFSITRKRINKKDCLKLFCVIFVVWLLKFIFERYQFSNFFDLLIYVSLIFIFKAKVIRTVIGCILTFIYTLLNSYIKGVCIIGLDFNNIYSLLAFIFSIDLYLTYFTIYLIILYRKEHNYGKMASILQIFKNLENYYCRRSNDRRSRTSSDSVPTIIKVYNTYCGVIFTIVVYTCLLIIGLLFGRAIEMTLCIVCFHILRGKESETFHCTTNDFHCFLISLINFSIVVKLTLPFYTSYIVHILLSYVLCVVMRLLYYIIQYVKTHKTRNRREKILAYVSNDEEEIEHLCSSLSLTDTSEIIYLYLNNTIEETSEILNIPVRTINNKINKFIKNLEC